MHRRTLGDSASDTSIMRLEWSREQTAVTVAANLFEKKSARLP